MGLEQAVDDGYSTIGVRVMPRPTVWPLASGYPTLTPILAPLDPVQLKDGKAQSQAERRVQEHQSGLR